MKVWKLRRPDSLPAINEQILFTQFRGNLTGTGFGFSRHEGSTIVYLDGHGMIYSKLLPSIFWSNTVWSRHPSALHTITIYPWSICCLTVHLPCVFVLFRNPQQQDLKEVSCCAQIIQELHKVLLKNERFVSKDTILSGTCLVFIALDHVAMVEEKLCQQNNSVQAQGWRLDVKEVTAHAFNWLPVGFAAGHSRAQTLEVCFVVLHFFFSPCFQTLENFNWPSVDSG